MANRIIQRYNEILNNIDHIMDYFTCNYMNYFTNEELHLSKKDLYSINNINMYYKVSGYDLYGKKEENESSIIDLAEILTNICYSNNSPIVYTVIGTSKDIQIYFGSNYVNSTTIKETLKNNLFSGNLENTWVKKDVIENLQRFNGVVSGLSKINVGDIDKIINSMEGDNFCISIISYPCVLSEIYEEISGINELQNLLQSVSQNRLQFGSSRVRNFDYENHDVKNCLNIITNIKNKLDRGTVNGLWRTCLWIGSDLEITYSKLKVIVQSMIQSRGDFENDPEMVRVHNLNTPFYESPKWYIPLNFVGKKSFGYLYNASLLSILESKEMSSYYYLPHYSHHGYFVNHLGESSVSTGAFDRVLENTTKGSSIFMGYIENNIKYSLPIENIRKHVFVTGGSQFGKTTTVKKILCNLNKEKVPFIVIEAAKKEYWTLKKYNETKNIQIYSSGSDGKQLYINPFQPELNTSIDTHIQYLIQAIISMFDDPAPLPQIITDLVYMCYDACGWDITRRYRGNENLEFPTFSDMLRFLDECVERVGYSKEYSEVKDNIKGAITIRLQLLMKGQTGKTINSSKNIPIAEMLRNSAIIELDDFAPTNKSFIASIIAIKVNEFSKQCKMTGNLERVLVIEEAHHLLPNYELKSVSTNNGECSKYFSNILAEISAYGTGVIVVDQSASKLSPDTIVNTGTKIVHNIKYGVDTETVASSISLKNYESMLLSKLFVGEAIIATVQRNEVCKVKIIPEGKENFEFHLGCLFCPEEICISCNDIENMISKYEREYIKANGYKFSTIKKLIECIENKKDLELTKYQKLRIAGVLSNYDEDNPICNRQELYDYYIFLGGEDIEVREREKA